MAAINWGGDPVCIVPHNPAEAPRLGAPNYA